MKKIYFFLLCLLLFAGQVFAQNRTITGKVTNEKGEPLVGVSINALGNDRKVIETAVTNANGIYSINVSEKVKMLQFSHVGLDEQFIPVGNKGIINLALSASSKDLSEVVVTGYGLQKKSNSTAAIVKVGGEQLADKPFGSIDQMLQGAAAGVQSVATTGQPGANQQIRIRGVGSFSLSASQPLYVIDGVVMNGGDLSNGNGGGFNINPSTNVLATLNADDIESVSILKDAAATSIYGSRGGNGVIIITTKSGKTGKTQFNFSAEYGNNNVIAPPAPGRALQAAEWFTLLKEGLVNNNSSQTTINNTLASYGYGNGVDIHWFDLVTQTGIQNQYNLSASGGDGKTKYFISGGYFRQQGTTIGTELTRYSGNIKITHAATDRLNFTTKVTIGDVVQNSALASSGISGGGGYFGNPGYVSLVLRPTQNPFNPDGTLNISGNNFGFPAHYNPLYIAANDKRWLKALTILGSENIEYKIWKSLKFTSNLGLQYNGNEEYQFNNQFHGDGSGTAGYALSVYTRNFLWNWYNQFDYHFDINKNKKFYADVKVGYEATRNAYLQQQGSAQSFPPKLDLYSSQNAATSTLGIQVSSDYAFTGAYSNANISYDDRYSLYGSFRRDGSSRFGSSNPFGNFYSIGFAWNVMNENFMKNITAVTNLKLRASYGTNGNAEIGNYQWRPSYGFGYNYNGVAGGTFNNIGNINLTWEQNKQFDVGFDLSLFKNRINITADYYKRKTDGSLLNQQISRTTGFTGVISNLGGLENKGIEFSISVVPIQTKDFSWQINFNYAHNKNYVSSLPTGDQYNPQSNTFLMRVGKPFYSFYTRGWAGVDPNTGSPLWYTDSTKSATTTSFASAKLFLVGKSASPTDFGGLGNTFTYKNFTLGIDFYYNYGNYIIDNYARFFTDGSFPTRGKYAFMLNRWQKKGDITNVPKYIYGDPRNGASGSDRIIYKGDYIRLRNLQVGYRLTDKNTLSKLHLSALAFYVRGSNLWTKIYDNNLTSDPEQGVQGFNNQSVAPSKSVTVGLNLTF
ncbi:SusC/RagA family TonB-linked outer membrane protein [Hydrotalea sp.]|uniref:SusC/RagA family TonB-linked outer membrane protein n=1 Tax=Hydrotalea sp. TaxID=2881279 RepID=UPI0026338C8C|nr:SusC/RagA family TonB-linked outer membrane protein [Hydrotalea sp.]